MTEETLSDKESFDDGEIYYKEDVKDFIKKLKEIEITKLRTHEYIEKVEELAGDKLI
jgi:hypothetical protein